ncbi:MAG: hypothetical protein PVG65_00495 [Candidatus Thorarchaeota archaeon]|jgi:hypothetical protein
MHKELLQRLKNKRSWIRIISKSGKVYNGQIELVGRKKIVLGYSYTASNENMKLHLMRSQIESIETLSCENPDVWTNEVEL